MRNRHVPMVLLLASPLTACGQQLVGWPEGHGDQTAPQVTATSPADGDVEVAANASIYATFDEHMDPLTLTTATFTLRNGVLVEGTVAPFGDMATVFAPAGDLESDQEYTATVTIEATDLAGNALARDYTWTFTTTGPDPVQVAPWVTLTDPADEAIGVPIDAMVDAAFSEDMDPATLIGANFEVTGPGTTPVAGTVDYDDMTRVGTFTPDDDLLMDTTYTATVTADAADLGGTPMDEDYVWTFSTEQPPPFLPPPIDLGILTTFVAVAGVAINNSAPTYLNGDVGLTPGSACTGCAPPDMYITGTLYVNDPEGVATQAKADLTDALIEAMAYPPGTLPPFVISADLHGQILAPGVYTSGSTMQISVTGTLTLDGQGDPNAFWIFQVGSALTVNTGARVVLVNGARAANVFWAVGSSSTIDANAAFQGTVLAQSSNSVGTNASVVGRLLCTDGAITLLSNSITLPPL